VAISDASSSAALREVRGALARAGDVFSVAIGTSDLQEVSRLSGKLHSNFAQLRAGGG
jgi:hypothetical protein